MGDGQHEAHPHLVPLPDEPPLPDDGYVREEAGPGQGTDPVRTYALLDVPTLLTMPPPRWLVDGLVTVGGLAVLYGPPGASKTFMALGVALAVAAGRPWCGRRVEPGAVVYLAGEGLGGFGQRIRAWQAHHHGADLAPFRLLAEPVNLLTAADVAALVATVAALPTVPALVVIDTLARSMLGGDENAARDVGLAVAAADQLRVRGSTVVVVHHSGKDGAAERGSSALRGAADTMAAITQTGDRVTVRCDKQKDAEPFGPIHLTRVVAGPSCVLVPDPGPPDPRKALAAKVVTALTGTTGSVPRETLVMLIGGRAADARGAIDVAADDPECPVTQVPGRRKGQRAYELGDLPSTRSDAGTTSAGTNPSRSPDDLGRQPPLETL